MKNSIPLLTNEQLLNNDTREQIKLINEKIINSDKLQTPSRLDSANIKTQIVSNKSKDIYLIGGGSKSDFLGNMISFVLNKNILVGEDSEQGAALGVARLAMLATKEYKQSEVIKNIKIVRECFPSKIKSDQLQERYQTWKEIVNVNESIAKKIMEKKYE